MASPTTAILVVAIFWRSFSRRSRVSMKTYCGLRFSSCGFDPPRQTRNPQSTIRNQLWCSRNPSFLSRSPLQLNRPDPPRLLRAVVDQMDAAVARERPAIAREVTGEREPHRPRDRPDEQCRRRVVLRHRRIGKPEVALALPQDGDLGFEQQPWPGDRGAAQR